MYMEKLKEKGCFQYKTYKYTQEDDGYDHNDDGMMAYCLISRYYSIGHIYREI
jgi:hypothetical protein